MTIQQEPITLVDALHRASRHHGKGYTFLDSGLEPEFWSFQRMLDAAQRRAGVLRARGLRQGDRLALIVPGNRDFVLSFFGAVLAGIVPVPMYPPMSLARLEAYVQTIRSILRSSGARMLLTTTEASALCEPLLSGSTETIEVLTTEQLEHESEGACLFEASVRPEDPCFLQYTSGSTGEPKGVVVRHSNLVANSLAIMRDGLDCHTDRDCGVSWLPLYHDMGLIGFVLAPLVRAVPVVFISTLTFVKRPSVWLETVDRYRGTITFGPNFAFSLCAKSTPKRKLDLSCLRAIGCGAEPIQAQTMREFVARYQPHGLAANALMPCYGMAEATLAISFEPLDEPLAAVRIDRELYAERRLAVTRPVESSNTVEIVSCGRTFRGHAIAIADDAGRLLPEGSVGEVLFRGPSATSEYYCDERSTRELRRDGWLRTGDLGFMIDDRLYISGRMKDMFILHGRNYYPQDIEWAIRDSAGLRPGSVVAFAGGATNEEQLVIVAECRRTDDPGRASVQIRQCIAEQIGLHVGEVVLVAKGTLPKTTSGKVRRRETRLRHERGTLQRTVQERSDDAEFARC